MPTLELPRAIADLANALAPAKDDVAAVTPAGHDVQRQLFKVWTQALSRGTVPTDSPLEKSITPAALQDAVAAVKAALNSLPPSLCAFHLRSPNIPSGRLTVAMDSSAPDSLDSWSYHDALLQVYFEIYGRARTFNELVFDRFVNGGQAKFTFNFSSSREKCPIVSSGQHVVEVTISAEIQKVLLPEVLRQKVLRTQKAAALLKKGKPHKYWHTLLCGEGVIESLAECVEMAYCHFSAQGFPDWRPLLEILHPLASGERKEWGKDEWNRAKRALLHGGLKSLQGMCLYQRFAANTLTTVAQQFKETILGVTVGFSAETNNELVSVLQQKLEHIHSRTVLASSSVKERSLIDEPNGDPWVDAAKGIFSDHPALPVRLRDLAHKLQPLRFAVHEGHPLCFTVYVGKQTVLSRFRYFHEFNATDETAALDKHFANVLKAHYSLFLDGITGIFCDELSEMHFGLVKPLRLRAGSHTLIQARNLDDNDLERANLEIREFFSSLSAQTSGLAVLHVSLGRMEIFFNGKLALQSSEKTDFHWRYVAAATDQWQIANLTHLLLQRLGKHAFKNLTCNNLAAAIQRVSDATGHGGLLVIDTASNAKKRVLNGMKSGLNPSKLSVWSGGKLFDYSVDGLVQLIIPDGATLICANTYLVENQVQVIPIRQNRRRGVAVDLAAMEEEKFNTKGTKHQTAKAITTVSVSLTAICISADGPISVFHHGKIFPPSQLEA